MSHILLGLLKLTRVHQVLLEPSFDGREARIQITEVFALQEFKYPDQHASLLIFDIHEH
jgi:hypothetical protein